MEGLAHKALPRCCVLGSFVSARKTLQGVVKTRFSKIYVLKITRFHITSFGGRGRQEENQARNKKGDEKMKRLIFGPGKAEIGLGTAIFGISVKNYRGYRNSRPNPCPGDPFRDRLKMVVVVEGDGRWWWRVEVKGGGGRWW